MLRKHDVFGGDCLVLLINDPRLQDRHDRFHRDPSLKWDFDSYNPHVTVAVSDDHQNFDRIIPWIGPIVLGPEIAGLAKKNGVLVENSYYVHRKVINSKEIKAWYEGMGIKNTEPQTKLHVTVVHSKSGPSYEHELDTSTITITN